MKIYVASSWRNERHPRIVEMLQTAGHDVYDFRNPIPGNTGFAWSDIDLYWRTWMPGRYIEALNHPLAIEGFTFDMNALRTADATLLVMPCGRSAHLELGWAVGAGQHTAILFDRAEPELMYKMVDLLTTDIDDVIDWLKGLAAS